MHHNNISRYNIMTCYDVYCAICGNAFHIYKELYKREGLDDIEIKNIIKITKWFSKITVLASDDTVHKCKEYECNLFYDKKGNYDAMLNDYKPNYFSSIKHSGIPIHNDCYKYVKNKFKIKLKFSNFPIFKTNKFHYEPIVNIKYDKITKYWNQLTDYHRMYKDNNMHMALSPLVNNNENNKRINKIVKQFKIKINRPSPLISATLHNNGDIKIGENKKFWIVKNNKWVEMKGTIVTKKIKITDINDNLKKKINNINQIGYHSPKPLFVKSIDKKYITLIGLDNIDL